VAGIAGFRWWSRREAARNRLDRIKMKLPVAGEIWLKYQWRSFRESSARC